VSPNAAAADRHHAPAQPPPDRASGQIVLPTPREGDTLFVSAEHRYPPVDDTGPPEPGVDWWADTVDRINNWWVHRPPAWPAVRDWARATPRRIVAAAAALVAAAVLAAVTAVVWLASAVYGLVTAAVADGHHTGTAGARWLAAWRLTRTITDPVHTYLTGHAAAVHTSGSLLWTGWLATTAVLLMLAVARSTGARIGWTLTGALTTFVVYLASPADARLLATGIAVTAWSLLSIAAFNRITTGRRGPDITVITHAETAAAADDGDDADCGTTR
jgi:hypothetical protein